jgi:O-antigen ligase
VAARAELDTRGLQFALVGLAVVIGLVAGAQPEIAVVAAIALAFVGVVLVDLPLGLCLFAIVAFMDLLPEFGAAFSFSKLAGLLLAASWLATVATRRQTAGGFVSAYPFVSYALVLFLAWASLSVVWAEDASESPVSLSRYLLNAFLFIIIFSAVRERRHVAWVLGAYLTGAALSAAYGFVAPAPTAAVEDRVTGTIGDPNELASVLLPAFVIGLGLAAAMKRAPVVRFLALSAAVISVAGLFLTVSRGGLVALVVALLAAIAVGGRWRPIAAVIAVLIGLAGVGYFVFFASPEAQERVTTVGGGTGREDIWTVGLREFEANPITGVGVGNFQTSSVHYLLAPGEIQRSEFIVDQPKVAHNTYLHILAELGIPGLLLFLTIVAFSVWCAYRAARVFQAKRDYRMELLARATLVGVIGLLADIFFISEMYSKQLWLLLGFCPALLAVARRQPVATPDVARVRSGSAGRWSAAPSPTARESELEPEPAGV